MLLKYFHDSVLSGHLGALKTFQKIAGNFYWPKMRAEIFDYVHRQWRTQEFFSGGGVQQIQLRTEERENGDLGAVAP